jgi:hypothetical protein
MGSPTRNLLSRQHSSPSHWGAKTFYKIRGLSSRGWSNICECALKFLPKSETYGKDNKYKYILVGKSEKRKSVGKT